MFLEPKIFIFKKTSNLYSEFLHSPFRLKKPIYAAKLKELNTLNFKRLNWESSRTYLFLNPKTSRKEKNLLKKAQFPYLKGHIWIKSSGTSSLVSSKNFPFPSSFSLPDSFSKFIALSKKSLLFSSKVVNQHVRAQKKDIWLNALPKFHVGGLSIFIRAYLSGSRVICFNLKLWSASHFLNLLHKKNVSLTSLVPAQLWDLVQLNRRPPKSLRAVFIGGDKMSSSLYFLARKQGWNVLPTYGLTEAASQVATTSLSSLRNLKIEKRGGNLKTFKNRTLPPLKILNFTQVKIENDVIHIKSPSLFTGVNFIFEKKNYFFFRDKNQWFKTSDMGSFVYKINQKGKGGEKTERFLFIRCRKTDEVKVGGELLSLKTLFFVFDQFRKKFSFLNGFQLIATPSSRLGMQVDVVIERKVWRKFFPLLNEYQKQVMPFERVRNIYVLENIRKTGLLKVNEKALLKQLEF